MFYIVDPLTEFIAKIAKLTDFELLTQYKFLNNPEQKNKALKGSIEAVLYEMKRRRDCRLEMDEILKNNGEVNNDISN